jgi:hypothetical protein
MHSSALLWDLYEEWKRLTNAEGAAIKTSDWSEVRRCQTAKKQLQPKIIHLSESAKAECLTLADQDRMESQIRDYVNQLILLETKNNDILQSRLEHLTHERSEVDRTTARLRKVQKSYGASRDAIWDRYS